MPDDVVLPYPEPLTPLRQVRSTLVLTSVKSIRDAGQYERYVEVIAPDEREIILGLVAGAWIDAAHAEAHYRACDALGLTTEQQRELGRVTFTRAKGTIFGTAVRLAQDAGVTPWTVLPHFGRFWARGFEGGGVQILRLGPKDAEIAVKQCSLVDVPYFRNAMRGIMSGMLELFCRQAYVRENKRPVSSGAVSLHAQWV